MYLIGYKQPESYGGKRYGDKVKIDINELIESIVVSQNAHNWFFEVIESTVEKFGFNFKIQ